MLVSGLLRWSHPGSCSDCCPGPLCILVGGWRVGSALTGAVRGCCAWGSVQDPLLSSARCCLAGVMEEWWRAFVRGGSPAPAWDEALAARLALLLPFAKKCPVHSIPLAHGALLL